MVSTADKKGTKAPVAPIETVYLRDAFPSLMSPNKILKLVGDSAVNADDTITTVVPLQALSEKEYTIFSDLTTLLGVSPSNAGYCIYDENWSQKFFGYPRIGLAADGTLGLLIGADQKDSNQVSAFVPMVYKETGDEEGEYYLGKCKCALISITDPNDNKKQRHYISIKSKRFIYNISFKPVDDLDSNAVAPAYYSGQFELVCGSFQGAFGILNKMFQKCFKPGGVFPKEGVLFLLSGGYFDENIWEGKTLISTKWRVEAVSHGELIVDGYKADSISLKEIKTLSCPGSCKLTKNALEEGLPAVAMVYVEGKNSRNAEHIPEHTSITDFSYISPAIRRKFAPIIEKGQKMLEIPAATQRIAEGMGEENDIYPNSDPLNSF